MLSSAAIAYFVAQDAFVLTGRIDAGPLAPQLPKFSANFTSDDGTAVTEDLPQMLRNMGTLSLLLPLVAVMQHVAIAKAFCELFYGKRAHAATTSYTFDSVCTV